METQRATSACVLQFLSECQRDVLRAVDNFDVQDFLSRFTPIVRKNFQPETDSCERRLMISISQQLVRILWSERNFQPFTASGHLQDLLQLFVRSAPSVQFSKDHVWFGGTAKTASESLSNNTQQFIPFLFVSLVACTTPAASESDVQAYLKRVGTTFLSPGTLVDAIIEQDEGCLSVMLLLLQLKCRGYECSDNIHPYALFLELLRHIGYEPEVMIDWLNSEPVAAPFLLSYCKTLERDYAHVQMWAARLQQTSKDARHCPTYKVSRSNGASSSRFLSFQVDELHGTEVTRRSVQISCQPNAKISKTDAPTTTTVPIEEELYDFMIRLRIKLEKLQSTGLAPFNLNTLVKIIQRLENRMET